MRKYVALSALTLAAFCGAGAAQSGRGARESRPTARPRLVVVLSIDQFRADYLTRFSDLYLPAKNGSGPGGFRYLQSRGAWFPDCRYEHYRTVTAVGHSILGTGAQPSLSGIVGNAWFNRETRKSVYSTDDPDVQVVGAAPGSKEKPMSPANQLVTTVGDELELATGNQAKTVAVSLKDRASILLAGHRADTVIWFDETTGGWVSSSYYCKDSRLPAWVSEFNRRKLADQLRQKPWEPVVSEEGLKRVWNPKGGSLRFSHKLTGSDYGAFATSPAGSELVFATARQAVESEKLGQDEIPDILSLNLASNDYVGHKWGPDSPEVLDISVQTDRQISEFLGYLDEAVPGGLKNVTFAISADHGAANVPEVNATSGVPASRAVASTLRTLAEAALDQGVAPDDWVISTENGEVYFNDATVARHPEVTRESLETRVVEALRGQRGVYFVIGKTAILSGRVPQSDLGRRITQSIHPHRSGDVVVVLQPQWLAGAAPVGTGTSHGAPYPYDTHVPMLVAGAGITQGIYTQPVAPSQLAPSLSFLLGCPRPSAADGAILPGFTVGGL